MREAVFQDGITPPQTNISVWRLTTRPRRALVPPSCHIRIGRYAFHVERPTSHWQTAFVTRGIVHNFLSSCSHHAPPHLEFRQAKNRRIELRNVSNVSQLRLWSYRERERISRVRAFERVQVRDTLRLVAYLVSGH